MTHNSTATGYESSIYISTPMPAWIFLLFSITVGSSVIILQIYNQRLEHSHLWKFSLILVYLCNIFVISLFIIRGYYSWSLNGDAGTHIGSVYHILDSGYLDSELFYPITHIYATQLSLFLELDMIFLHKIIPLLFGILHIPFMYLFAKQILQEKSQVLLVTLVSCTFLYGWYLNFTPNTLANLLFPLLLYIMIKPIRDKRIAWGILIVIMALLYPVFHPVPSIAFVGILAFIFIPNKVLFWFDKNKYNLTLPLVNKIKFALILILFVWGLAWISSFYIWKSTLVSVNMVLFEGKPSQLASLVSLINEAQEYGYSVTEQIMKKLGGIFVYFFLALACAPIILKKLSKNPDDVKLRTLFSLYGPLTFFGILIAVNYFLDLGFGPLRFVVYLVLISTILANFYLITIMEKYKQRGSSSIPFIVILLVVGIFIHSVLFVYPSPYILESSQQTTKSELDGMQWLLDNRNVDVQITGYTAAPYRFVDMLPPSEIKKHKIPQFIIPEEIKPPFNRFGYNSTNSIISTYYYNDVYFIILDRDRLLYVDVFPEMAHVRWTSDDFKLIDTDVSVNQIYSNEGLVVYRINANSSR